MFTCILFGECVAVCGATRCRYIISIYSFLVSVTHKRSNFIRWADGKWKYILSLCPCDATSSAKRWRFIHTLVSPLCKQTDTQTHMSPMQFDPIINNFICFFLSSSASYSSVCWFFALRVVQFIYARGHWDCNFSVCAFYLPLCKCDERETGAREKCEEQEGQNKWYEIKKAMSSTTDATATPPPLPTTTTNVPNSIWKL